MRDAESGEDDDEWYDQIVMLIEVSMWSWQANLPLFKYGTLRIHRWSSRLFLCLLQVKLRRFPLLRYQDLHWCLFDEKKLKVFKECSLGYLDLIGSAGAYWEETPCGGALSLIGDWVVVTGCGRVPLFSYGLLKTGFLLHCSKKKKVEYWTS